MLAADFRSPRTKLESELGWVNELSADHPFGTIVYHSLTEGKIGRNRPYLE